MATNSSIEWTEATWNPIVGCTVLSPGCTNCYAMRMAARLEAMGQAKYTGVTRKTGGRHSGLARSDDGGSQIRHGAPPRVTKPRAKARGGE